MASREEKKKSIQLTLSKTKDNYNNAKQSFDNWLAARKTVGSPREDKEVLLRANQLDEYFKTQQAWRNELSLIESDISRLYDEIAELRTLKSEERDRAQEELSIAMRSYELSVFVIRLLFIFPILLLSIFFMVKFRKHKYWPLFLGFILFGFYGFFFGLVPYLPSYGGYVRYTVGIVLSVIIGIYAINKFREYLDKKKNELKESSTERAKKVQIEIAEKAFDKHICPSCGKDFIIKNWDKSQKNKSKQDILVL